MMQYRMEVACIIIVCFIFGLYKVSRKRETDAQRFYFYMLVCSTIQLIASFAKLYVLNNVNRFSNGMFRISHQAYVFFLILMMYYMVLYLIAMIKDEISAEMPKVSDKVKKWLNTIIVLGVLLLPVSCEYRNGRPYSAGPLIYLAYLAAIISNGILFWMLYRYWKYMDSKKKQIMLFSTVIESLVVLYQAFFPDVLVTGIGVTLIVLGSYITVENPDALIIEELKEETKRADAANNAKSSFLARISHEIRTPINAVLGMDEMILRESEEAEIREYASNIKASAKTLLQIINDILDITKIENGKLELLPVNYDTGNLVCAVANMFFGLVEEKGIKLEVIVDEKLPSRLLGDDIRLRQILTNLLSNAVKYTHQGTVKLKIKVIEANEYAKVLFEVSDTGIGMREEDLDKLYVAFERIEESRNRGIEGTGLGMVITKNLLNLMDSDLNVRSVYGKGTIFSFVISQKIIDAEPVGDLKERMEVNTQQTYYEGNFEAPAAQILLVDDSSMNRRVFCSLLKETRMHITEAVDGEECLAIVKKKHFDLIFMDHRMPGMDGVEAFREMKKLSDYPCKDTPVIILTANAVRGAKEQYMAEGFHDFLTKPLEPEKLENMIQKWLPKELQQNKNAEELEEIETKGPTLPMIGGVDWGYAKLHFAEIDEIGEMMEFFCSMAETEAEELDSYYKRIREAEFMELYHVKVHSMKNSAGMVGILPLNGMAKILEDAVVARDLEKIQVYHNLFLEEWRTYTAKIQKIMDEEKAENRQESTEAEPEIICGLLTVLGMAIYDMDIDRMDNVILQLKQYNYPVEAEKILKQLAAKVAAFDLDESSRLVQKFLEYYGG